MQDERQNDNILEAAFDIENRSNYYGAELSTKAEIKDDAKKREVENRSFTIPADEDGARYVASGVPVPGFQSLTWDLEGKPANDDKSRILKYREIAQFPEVDQAIEEIINECIVSDDEYDSVEIDLQELENVSENIQGKIREEFEEILRILQFKKFGHDIFRRWYVDGRIIHHIVIDKERPKDGIRNLIPIDPIKIEKVKEVKKEYNSHTKTEDYVVTDEYYVYKESESNNSKGQTATVTTKEFRINTKSLAFVTSGLLNPERKSVISYLDKAIKPSNQLNLLEDSLIIYRLSRAPERRIFYVDVGNLPKSRADQYLNDIMTRYRNKLTYDSSTGQVKDARKFMAMIEDFWLPRREGGRGTEISTLPGGQNLSDIDDIVYFQKKLYRSLNVPLSRLEQESTFSFGRAQEVTREEVKFAKFVSRLRAKFSDLFYQILGVQLQLKGILSKDEWNENKNDVKFNFIRDNHFTELKESELIRERIATLREVDEFTGRFFSKKWIQKNVLRFSDEDIEDSDEEIEKEKEAGVYDDMADMKITNQPENFPPEGLGSEGDVPDKPPKKSNVPSPPSDENDDDRQ